VTGDERGRGEVWITGVRCGDLGGV
jgi:hypothetical protein